MAGWGNSHAPVGLAKSQTITIQVTSGRGPAVVSHSAQVIIAEK